MIRPPETGHGLGPGLTRIHRDDGPGLENAISHEVHRTMCETLRWCRLRAAGILVAYLGDLAFADPQAAGIRWPDSDGWRPGWRP